MLFQPSNIYPSTFSGIGAGTVDVTQGINVSWQVNGDTPMTAYQIKIYQNDTSSTLMYDSGSVSVSPAFEPHDKYGNSTFYTVYLSSGTLSGAGITNGYQYGYKMLLTQWWGVSDYVEQTSASVFITRTLPTLSIDAIPNPVTTNSLTITATYAQAQGDPISTVEWVFALAGQESNPIKETGAVSTQILSFDADGLITGNTYSVMCNVVTSNGVEVSTGWVQFAVSYASSSASINYNLAQMKNSSAVLLTWDSLSSNVLSYPYEDSTKTTNGITFTVNGEGDVSASGTASADAYFTYAEGTLSDLGITAGQKLLVSAGYSGAVLEISETNSSNVVVFTMRGDDPLQYIVPSTTNTLKVSCVIPKGTVLSTPQTIQPMICAESRIVSVNGLTAQIVPIQTGSGTPAPGNIRPITGFTGLNAWDDPVYGGTIEWNQLVANGNFVNTNGWNKNNGTISASSNKLTFEATAKSTYQYINHACSMLANHKILMTAEVTLSQAEKVGFGDGSGIVTTVNCTANTKSKIQYIYTPSANRSAFYIYPGRNAGLEVGATMIVENVMAFDLTEMFGAGNEPSAINSFITLFPKSYYEYTASSIKTCVSAVNGNSYWNISLDWTGNAGTVYGGTADISAGILTVTMANIASYNGESIGEPWLSSMDEYTPGGTPTTGAQVVYTLTSPLTYSIASQKAALFTANNIWSDTGDVTVSYTKNNGTATTASGAVVSFSDSKAVNIPIPGYVPGVSGVSIYRYEQGDPVLHHVIDFSGDMTGLLDYFAPSQKQISYLFVVHASGTDMFMQTKTITPVFWFYSILLCDTDSDGIYHVSKEYIFKYGVETGAVSNNNTPTLQKNFTRYPLRQPISSLYKTGKVTSYIGTVDGYNTYSDSVSLQNAIYDISSSMLPKFLKSRKGDVLSVDTSGAIQMQTEDKTVQQALKATIEWAEVGDASQVSIVSIPTDSFWPLT